MLDLKNLTIEKAHNLLVKKEITCKDLALSYLENIKVNNKDLNIYLEVYDDVLDQAENAQDRFDSGEKDNLLLGIPVAVKDNILVKGRKVGAASKILEGYIATYDSTVIKKLKEKGVVFLGRANMDEFAMGASTENSAYGVTKNPHDLTRVAGGSSGGSAAAVASSEALVSLGSDTGGSIRQPSAFCGVVGFKPTYGMVSRYGLIAMASSLDQIGPMAKNVADAKILFEAIRGFDEMDSTSLLDERSLKTQHKRDLKKKIGVSFDMVEQGGIHPEVKKNFYESIEKLKKTGYEIVEVNIPNISYSLPVYYVLCPAEVSSNMARFDGVKYGKVSSGDNLLEDYMKTRGELLGKEVRRRIMLGTYVLSAGYYDAYYGKALTLRELIKNDFKKIFEEVDVVAMPTTPTPSFKIGEKSDDPLEMYLADVFTVTANLIGSPAISIPSGLTSDGTNLPLAIQFVGPFAGDDIVLDVGKDFEDTQTGASPA